MQRSANVDTASALSIDPESDDDLAPLRCWDCNVNFTNKHYLYSHLFHHIKQPFVVLDRLQLPPLKLTLKSKSGNNFEIISSPLYPGSWLGSPSEAVYKFAFNLAENVEESDNVERGEGGEKSPPPPPPEEDQEATVTFSPNLVDLEPVGDLPANEVDDTGSSNADSNATDYASVPGAEPTPPPEPSPDYPKIRIKTTGLLKEPLTITEITDDNPEGDPTCNSNNSNMWTTPSLEDPLKLPDSDDSSILSLFNNNERAKDLGFHTSDSEFISLDRLEERNRGAMQLYNPPSTSQSQNPLDSLTGLPMQALAQQVSRLQPSGNGMHQQNVLINIQQFPTGPPQPSYQPPPMYPHYPPQPMHQPYQYPPPNPMYYPPAPPTYPSQHMPPPPQPQMGQMGQPPMNQQQMGAPPPMNQPQMNQNQNPLPPSSQPQNMNHQMQQPSAPYRQPMPPRPTAPRQPNPGVRMPGAPRQPMGQRQPMTRQRAPMIRPRGATMSALRGIRPRMANPLNGVRQQQPGVKRTPEQIQALQAKKKRFDLLTPDKDDDDCQVICMQPKNTDGGLPQIESVQGGTSEPSESSIMHLSDSITLSVRNPPPKPASPKKSDAKAVANILATRGITVTATAKPKDKQESPQKAQSALPSALNLNGAVSIIPAAKNNVGAKGNSVNESLPTVDLTDDNAPPPTNSAQKQRPGLPYRCDLCPAQYPNALGLSKHRQSYHKTTGGMCELGIPLINLKQPGILQKLSSMGINNYIPLPSSGPDGMFALPIISTRNPGNVGAIGSTSMLSLGPIRSIPKPQNNIGSAAKQLNQKS